jgi:hypothetical protein
MKNRFALMLEGFVPRLGRVSCALFRSGGAAWHGRAVASMGGACWRIAWRALLRILTWPRRSPGGTDFVWSVVIWINGDRQRVRYRVCG